MNLLEKSIIYLLIVYWSYSLLFPVDHPWIFIDGVNLIFHEAGHVIFSVLGQFMYVLGGSLMQCLIPVVVGIYFLLRHEYFAANFCLFWLGNNYINISEYIKDSRAMILPLLGGDPSGHDWHWLLSTMNLLQYDGQIGGFVWACGVICLLGALTAGGSLLLFEFTNAKEANTLL